MKRKKEIKTSWIFIAQTGRNTRILTKIKAQKKEKIRLGIGILSSALNIVEGPSQHPCTVKYTRTIGNLGIEVRTKEEGLWGETRSPSP